MNDIVIFLCGALAMLAIVFIIGGIVNMHKAATPRRDSRSMLDSYDDDLV